MSKSSQESSPITQWREKVSEELISSYNTAFWYGEDGKELREPDLAKDMAKSILPDLTSATIELIEGLIPAKRKIPAFSFLRFNKYYGGDYAIVRDSGYNLALAELRQSLKEMNHDNS